MTAWRTDTSNIPSVVDRTQDFDVVVIDGSGKRWRETDCIKNASGQICRYDRDFGYEPIEYDYGNGEFQRVTHWSPIELPPLEDKGRPG